MPVVHLHGLFPNVKDDERVSGVPVEWTSLPHTGRG